MNAFFVYRKAVHKNIAATCGTTKNNEISVIAGRCWSNETAAVRDHFRCLAEKMAGEKNDEENAMATVREDYLQRARSNSLSSVESAASSLASPARSVTPVSLPEQSPTTPLSAQQVFVPAPAHFKEPAARSTVSQADKTKAFLATLERQRARSNPYPPTSNWQQTRFRMGLNSEPKLLPFAAGNQPSHLTPNIMIGGVETRTKQVEFVPRCGTELEAALQSWMAMMDCKV